MEEEALEELKQLEAQYPNQFEHLKNELRSFITQLQSNHHTHTDSPQPEINNIHYDTQESTSLEQMKRIKSYGLGLALADKVTIMEERIDEGCELVESPRTVIVKHHHHSSRNNHSNNKRKLDRVDLVLERAQTCLKKLRHLKTSLLSP
ncbi:hypothetical protein HN51_061145 [Arachis hypogaea]|uniref:Uncharacterized protein n=1 Tax=Arachis hypogaea TaxID=3818 RepID=A0A445AMF5_ARAHY|nr:uncharacterized protein LOC107616056 [Arachis ipaensis]XP_025626322.1 uncharacterized protein LOC112719826 [Arachis hypogaea]QHO18329.1 uncharacterized protein DS421_11g319570 [Arachis hypogaea]RYR27520.1 hypothetical protein Ahy_B01g051539 [Arachis hypogaea]